MATNVPPEMGPVFEFIFTTAGEGGFTNQAEDRNNRGDPFESEKSRAERREDAVKRFREAAQKTTTAQVRSIMQALLSNLIQLRAVGGTLVGTEVPEMMRGALSFMEDQ